MKRFFSVFLRVAVIALAFSYCFIKDALHENTLRTFSRTPEIVVCVGLILVIGIVSALSIAKFKLSKWDKLIVALVILAAIAALLIFGYPAYVYPAFTVDGVLILVLSVYLGDLILNNQ